MNDQYPRMAEQHAGVPVTGNSVSSALQAFGSDGRLALGGLPAFLSWESGVNLLRFACATHIRWLFARLAAVDRERGSSLRDRVRLLPHRLQSRLLLAPAVHSMLHVETSNVELHRLEEFVAIEEATAAGRSLAGWSALGESAEGAGNQMCGHFVVDSGSPHHTVEPEKFGQLVEYSPEELVAVRSLVAGALDIITRRSELASSMIRECTRVLRATRSSSSPNMAGSYSFRQMIGLVGLVNGHDPATWTPMRCANNLVHEAIHSMIYKLELLVPLYQDERAAQELTARSPWSGRILPLHSFVHACFVWFGLRQFWTHCHPRSLEVSALLDKAESGFLHGDPMEAVHGAARDNVRPDVQRVITEMWSRTVGQDRHEAARQ